MRRAPTTHLGPRIRMIRSIVEAHPGISACEVARLVRKIERFGKVIDDAVTTRAVLASVARAVRGGWIQRGDGERPGLFPVPSP